MFSTAVRFNLTLFTLFSLISIAAADNWPHWRGENGNGVSTTANPPTSWNPNKNIKWKAEIPGQGSGSPIVWENQVFVVTGVGSDSSFPSNPLEFKLLSFDRESGKLLWQQTAITAKPHQETHSTNNFASASPFTDGEHVFAYFGSRGLFCYTMEGKLVWQKTDFGKMQTRNGFGEGSSPTLTGDKIIVPWDHEGQSYVTALEKTTGNTIWKTMRDEPTCWATPLVVEHKGSQQIIMNGENYARAYDLETGKELWRCGGQTQRPVASPVTLENMVFVGSGFRGSFLGAFELGGSGNLAGTEKIAWSKNQHTPDIASLLLSEDRLYYTKAKTAILTCVDAKTGKPYFSQQRLPDLSTLYASPIAAGGHVYVTGRSGNTVVLKDSEQLSIVATNTVGEKVDATPAPVDDQLFIRGEKHLFCIQE